MRFEASTSREVNVGGTTDAAALYVSVDGAERQVPLDGGAFDVAVTLPALNNQIVVASVAADGGTRQVVRSVQAFGDRLGGVTDPSGDDNGPGSYVNPTDAAFNPGSFDLTGFDVYRDGDNVNLVTKVAGAIDNPWGRRRLPCCLEPAPMPQARGRGPSWRTDGTSRAGSAEASMVRT